MGHEDNKCSVVNIKKLADNQTIDVLETKSIQVKTKISRAQLLPSLTWHLANLTKLRTVGIESPEATDLVSLNYML